RRNAALVSYRGDLLSAFPPNQGEIPREGLDSPPVPSRRGAGDRAARGGPRSIAGVEEVRGDRPSSRPDARGRSGLHGRQRALVRRILGAARRLQSGARLLPPVRSPCLLRLGRGRALVGQLSGVRGGSRYPQRRAQPPSRVARLLRREEVSV